MRCAVKNCTREEKYAGMCGLHYKRHWRHGNVHYTERPANPQYLNKCKAYECESVVGHSGAKGFCAAHYNRLYKYDRLHRVIAPKGSGSINAGGYAMVTIDGQTMYEHIHLAEKALGRKLPQGAVVHHTTRDRRDNHGAFKLVICPDQSYHMLLHFRARCLGYE